jgi:quercetin dioxygenase-like cupin family protein
MKKVIRFVVGMAIPAFIMAGGMASSAVAQEKAAKAAVTSKVLLENAKVRVNEVSLKPGDEIPVTVTSLNRVIRVLKGGTTQYTYADGKKETKVWKTGEVVWLEPGPTFSSKNIGKTEVQLYVVSLK